MEILEYLGKFHPVVLHLPIGALYLTFCLVLLEKFFKNNYTIPEDNPIQALSYAILKFYQQLFYKLA